jgi:putative FmdB family regulatory protein
MPIYEYRCDKCGKKSEFITFRISEEITEGCRHCGSAEVRRIPSRVRVRLSEETRLERLSDPSAFGGLDENDPASMARWMKKMGQEMGDELGEDVNVDEMIEEAMTEGAGEGESPSMGGMAGPSDEVEI